MNSQDVLDLLDQVVDHMKVSYDGERSETLCDLNQTGGSDVESLLLSESKGAEPFLPT